jgi:proteasome lid subunit RPN8/RPN11
MTCPAQGWKGWTKKVTLMVEKKFAVEIVYNGVTKALQVEPEERVVALLQKAIALFGVTQQPHLLSLFRENGTVVDENQSVEQAGLKAGEVLLLRPNVVKGGFERLRVAGDLLPATFRVLQDCGRGECECAAYWTGPSGGNAVDALEHPTHSRSPFGYQIDDDWLTNFWRQLAVAKRSVKAQVHTHPGGAFHSTTDDRWPIVSQTGFISIVLPSFATGRPSLDDAWVGVMLQDGSWEQQSGSEVLVMS